MFKDNLTLQRINCEVYFTVALLQYCTACVRFVDTFLLMLKRNYPVVIQHQKIIEVLENEIVLITMVVSSSLCVLYIYQYFLIRNFDYTFLCYYNYNSSL